MGNTLEELQREAELQVQETEATQVEATEADTAQQEIIVSNETVDAPTEVVEQTQNVNSAQAENNTENSNTETATEEIPPVTPTKSFVSEKAAMFDEFVRKTGKEDFREFEFWQTPTSEVDENELLRKYLSEQEGMTEKEIVFELNRMTVPVKGDDDFEDDFDDNQEGYSEKEILRERTLRKAKSWHEAEFQKIASEDAETSPYIAQRLTVEEYNQQVIENQKSLHEENVKKVYETLPNLNGIELKVMGNEALGIDPLELIYTPDEDSKKILRSASEDAGTVVNQFFNEGQLIDPKGWIQLMAKVALNEKIIQHAVEQAVLNDRAAQDRRKRNVTTDNYQPQINSSKNEEEEFENWRNSNKN